MNSKIQLLLVIILLGVAVWIGRTTAPTPIPVDTEYIEMQRQLDSITNLHEIAQETLYLYMKKFGVEKKKGDSLSDQLEIEAKKKKEGYEEINYPNMSGDSSYTRAITRLHDRIDG